MSDDDTTPASVRARLEQFFDVLIEKIRTHPEYGPNMEDASEQQGELILDYHTHGGDHGYCVAIRRRQVTLPLLAETAPLQELVHVQGVGQEADECGSLMSILGARLQAAYGLESAPLIYFDGAPWDAG